jgi:hypothetical protein
MAFKLSGPPLYLKRLMNGSFGKRTLFTAVEPEVFFRVESPVAQPFTPKEYFIIQIISGYPGIGAGGPLLYLGSQLISNPLISVKIENPVTGSHVMGRVFLRSISVPVTMMLFVGILETDFLVRSVLPESTITISSAKDTLSRQARIFSSSP